MRKPKQPRLQTSRRLSPNASRSSLLGTGLGLCLAFAASLPSCVNVVVNFPESAVQQATDDYVKDLYRAKEKGRTQSPDESATPSSAPSATTSLSLIPEAWAMDFEFNVNSPKGKAIFEKLKAHVPDVISMKKSGTLGETNDGLLSVRGQPKPLLKQKADKLVKEENAEREDLYEEVVSSNHLPKNRLIDIKRSFTRSFQSVSPSGTWLQDSEGNWVQKP